jgi:hypothetical protein
MKPFSIEAWKKNPDACITRAGDKVLELTKFESLKESEFTLVGILYGCVNIWKENGKYWKVGESSYDLMIQTTEEVAYVNLYKNSYGTVYLGGLFATQTEAEKTGSGKDSYIKTIEVSWEE